jgi:hypothetical protein
MPLTDGEIHLVNVQYNVLLRLAYMQDRGKEG